MSFSTAKRDTVFGFPEDRPESFQPIDREALSENALFLLDRYRIDNANDPMAIFVSMVDKMSANQREVISRFEAAIALAGVEFGRIDLAIEKAEENQRQVNALAAALDRIQKDFAFTTDKIRQRTNSDIVLNHLKPCIYGLSGAILTLLVLFLSLRLKIL
ncbi:MAG: hypothetical protein JO279_05535 [Verrucomicrobia bacterium]|nr:hypothetical protein [Verrucomicrobiota bacterium]